MAAESSLKSFPGSEIVIDVAAFYNEHHFRGEGFPEYEKYVRPEQEVIVAHSVPIVLTSQNTTVLEREIAIKPPMIGDRFFWHSEDENGYEIEDVDHEQPYAYRGIFYVTPDRHGHHEPVRNVGPGEWEFFEIEQ